MEPEGSLPHPQKPTTCPHLYSDQSNLILPLTLHIWIADWKTKDSNGSKHSLISICSQFLPEWHFVSLGLFQNSYNISALRCVGKRLSGINKHRWENNVSIGF